MQTPYSQAALAAEISADPVTLGYAGKTPQQQASLLSSLTTGRKMSVIVARAAIKTYFLGNGKLPAVLSATTPNARLVQSLFADPDYSTINVADPVFLALLAGLVNETLISQADVDAVKSMGMVMCSRAQEL